MPTCLNLFPPFVVYRGAHLWAVGTLKKEHGYKNSEFTFYRYSEACSFWLFVATRAVTVYFLYTSVYLCVCVLCLFMHVYACVHMCVILCACCGAYCVDVWEHVAHECVCVGVFVGVCVHVVCISIGVCTCASLPLHQGGYLRSHKREMKA